MIVAREERGTNVERGHGGWRMTVRLNTLMNVRRFFLLLMMTPVQMERMLATVRLPMGGMIGVLAIGVQVMNVQLGRMKMTSAFLQKTLMVRLMSAQGGVRR